MWMKKAFEVVEGGDVEGNILAAIRIYDQFNSQYLPLDI
jgi:hypothetical protein